MGQWLLFHILNPKCISRARGKRGRRCKGDLVINYHSNSNVSALGNLPLKSSIWKFKSLTTPCLTFNLGSCFNCPQRVVVVIYNPRHWGVCVVPFATLVKGFPNYIEQVHGPYAAPPEIASWQVLANRPLYVIWTWKNLDD